MALTERVTTNRLVLSERVKIALDAVIDEYAEGLDHDPHLQAIRIEVRVGTHGRAKGEITRVMLDRQSEMFDSRDRRD